MALPHMVEEEDGEGDDLNFQAVVPEDVQNVMTAAEEGDSSALSRAIGMDTRYFRYFLFCDDQMGFETCCHEGLCCRNSRRWVCGNFWLRSSVVLMSCVYEDLCCVILKHYLNLLLFRV